MDKSVNPLVPKRTRKKTSYNKITNQTRQKLIEMVYVRNCPLKDAAIELGINYSTAKTILRIFRIEKRVEKKNADEERVLKQLIYTFKKDKEINIEGTNRLKNESVNINPSQSETSTISITPQVPPADNLLSLKNLVPTPSIRYNISPYLDQFNSNIDLHEMNYDISSIVNKLNSIEDSNELLQYFNKTITFFQSGVKNHLQQIKNNQIILSQLIGLASNLTCEINSRNFMNRQTPDLIKNGQNLKKQFFNQNGI